jgi:hypothetical protein
VTKETYSEESWSNEKFAPRKKLVTRKSLYGGKFESKKVYSAKVRAQKSFEPTKDFKVYADEKFASKKV